MEKTDQSVVSSVIDTETHADLELDKRIRWRRDIVLIPILGLMYLVSGILDNTVAKSLSHHKVMFLDRTNIANARIEGLEAGLNMPSNGYNVALSIFYIPFVLFEIPSNLILSLPWVSPRWYLGSMMMLLGKHSLFNKQLQGT